MPPKKNISAARTAQVRREADRIIALVKGAYQAYGASCAAYLAFRGAAATLIVARNRASGFKDAVVEKATNDAYELIVSNIFKARAATEAALALVQRIAAQMDPRIMVLVAPAEVPLVSDAEGERKLFDELGVPDGIVRAHVPAQA